MPVRLPVAAIDSARVRRIDLGKTLLVGVSALRAALATLMFLDA